MSLTMGLFGMVFAFAKGWYYSCILIAAFPFLFAISYIVTKALTIGFLDSLKAYA